MSDHDSSSKLNDNQANSMIPRKPIQKDKEQKPKHEKENIETSDKGKEIDDDVVKFEAKNAEEVQKTATDTIKFITENAKKTM